jgi:predicted nucleotidyltransferase
MERVLKDLVERLKKAHPDGLVSVILYGSAAVGDHHGRFSDLNILCVLRQVTPKELAASAPVFQWWQKLGNPSPLLLSTEEVRNSTDCFPIEFHDIRERHRTLYGEDVVKDLEVDDSFYRAQVEHELRAKLLRLRQRGACVLADRELLVELLAESVSTFCVLIRHALRLHAAEAPHQKRDIVNQAAQSFGLNPEPFHTLLDVREQKRKVKDIASGALFENYLKQIEIVIGAVDRLDK